MSDYSLDTAYSSHESVLTHEAASELFYPPLCAVRVPIYTHPMKEKFNLEFQAKSAMHLPWNSNLHFLKGRLNLNMYL